MTETADLPTAPEPAPSTEAAAAPGPDLSPPDPAGRQTLTKGTRDERRARAIAAAKGMGQPTPPTKAPEAAPPTPEPAPVETVAAAPAEPPKAPEKPAPQSEAALALAKAQKAALQAQREAYEAKQRLKSLEDKAKELEGYQAKIKSANPLDLLQERGVTYEDLTKDIVEGKYKPLSAEQQALEAQKSELQKLQERLDAAEKREQEARSQEIRRQEVAHVSEQLKAAADQFPALASVPWGASKAVERVYEKAAAAQASGEYFNPSEALTEALTELNNAIVADAEPIFASDAFLQALLSKPEQRDRILRLAGIKQTQPAQQATQRATPAPGNSPGAIPQTKVADPGTRKTPSKSISPAQRRAAAVAAIHARRGA